VTALRYREVPPPADLRWAVECLWFADGPGGATERIVPDGCPELVIQLGAAMHAGDDAATLRLQPQGLVVGQRSRALLVSPRGGFRTVAARLRPAALGRLLRDHARSLSDGWASLEELFGRQGRMLLDRAEDAGDDGERQIGLEEFFRQRLSGAWAGGPLDGAVETLRRSRGRLTIRALRESTGASERWLERAFLREVGVPPRVLAGVLRVQAVLLLREEEPSWAQLASACGYYDQAHLIREFQQFAGSTPGRFLQSGSAPAALESGNDEPNETRKSDRLR